MRGFLKKQKGLSKKKRMGGSSKGKQFKYSHLGGGKAGRKFTGNSASVGGSCPCHPLREHSHSKRVFYKSKNYYIKESINEM